MTVDLNADQENISCSFPHYTSFVWGEDASFQILFTDLHHLFQLRHLVAMLSHCPFWPVNCGPCQADVIVPPSVTRAWVCVWRCLLLWPVSPGEHDYCKLIHNYHYWIFSARGSNSHSLPWICEVCCVIFHWFCCWCCVCVCVCFDVFHFEQDITALSPLRPRQLSNARGLHCSRLCYFTVFCWSKRQLSEELFVYVFVLLHTSAVLSFAQLLQLSRKPGRNVLRSNAAPPSLLLSSSFPFVLSLVPPLFKPKHPLCAVNSHSR